MSIPSLDLNQNLDKLELTNSERGTSSPGLRISPQPSGGMCDGFGDQSNSEDSSLSDSDRTLVGDAPGECIGMLSSSSNSPADQHMASPSDPAEDTYNYEVFGNPAEDNNHSEEMNWDDEETQDAHKFDSQELLKPQNYYFKVTSVIHQNDASAKDSTVRCVRVLADRRMTMERLKKHLEVFVRVPVEYFKLYKMYGSNEDEWSSLTDSLRLLKEGERIVVKLGRVLRKDEYNTKIYHLKLDNEPNNFLFDHIIAKGQVVSAVKKEILIQMKKQHMLDVPYNKCRLRDKSWKKPRKVYLDHQKFGDDIILTSNMEIYLQDLPDVETVTSDTQAVVFIRRWYPSTLTLGNLTEINLETSHVNELRKRLSEVSDIPLEHVDFAHVKSAFPCDMHILEITDELNWNPNVTHWTQWPLNADDGSVFFYRFVIF